MSEIDALTGELERIHQKFERLNIFDGDIEISIPVLDMLSMHRVYVQFRFSDSGALKWIDAEVRA